ncbi:Transcriptional regulator [Malassezia vespertilionis]|uniref:Ngg1p n=1 Tax=Malassezia vespertilionis TaxID=2020962 RepID=A0A2N1J8N1_9BASI|nr:Transcriptional regulator [Malassezia vespertilionis]PKI82908.1 Ngg1p [Malassezia vespertilionis]WFD08252.1 Transcriptional regulator [Malassezia vespertilionis]
MLPAQDGPDALASLKNTEQLYKNYMGMYNSAVPELDELAALRTHLDFLRNDADARLNALLTERGHQPRTNTSNATVYKNEENAGLSVYDTEQEWSHTNGTVSHTYGRGPRRQTAHSSPAEMTSSDLDTDMDEPSKPGASVRTGLGVKLRIQAHDPAHVKQPPTEAVTLRPRPHVVDVDETFVDDSKFSWDIPADVHAAALPQLEPRRGTRPCPTHPFDVHDDFANKDWRDRDTQSMGSPAPGQSITKDASRSRQGKDATQVPATTFYNYADAYFKPVTEDDLAWLSSKADDPYPFQFPDLGTPYRKVWGKEDAELLGELNTVDGSAQNDPAKARARALVGNAVHDDDVPLAHALLSDTNPACSFTLRELGDRQMYNRTAWCGPLTERLASSILVTDDDSSLEGAAYADTALVLEPPPDTHKTMAEVESQARQELEAVGLLEPGIRIPWEEHADSSISSALRQAQELLQKQTRMNEQRKARLFRIAQDRMAFQDYQACLQAIDREIEANWTKRQRQIKASMGKKRKGHDPNGTVPTEAAGPSKPQLPDTLQAMLARRRKLKEAFKPMFAAIPHSFKAPRESIYQGLDM